MTRPEPMVAVVKNSFPLLLVCTFAQGAISMEKELKSERRNGKLY